MSWSRTGGGEGRLEEGRVEVRGEGRGVHMVRGEKGEYRWGEWRWGGEEWKWGEVR